MQKKTEYVVIDELKEKSKIRVINDVRRHIKELVENADSDEGKVSLLDTVLSELSAADVTQPHEDVLKL